MIRTLTSTRLVVFAAAVPLTLLAPSSLFGQAPNLDVFYTKLEPKEDFKYKWKGKEAVCTAGIFRWEVPQSEFGTNGLDRNFTGYCAEVLVPMASEKSYRFQIGSIASPENYPVANAPEPEKAAQRRVKYIQELYGRYYRDALVRPVNPDEAVGFQLAMWELIQESEPAEGEAKFDLFAGDFQANSSPAEAPASVKKAQEYLGSLTGNDSLYYENPDLKGRELIRLKGIPNAEGETAQSQFALRYAGGGGIGSPNRPLTAGNGGGAPVAGSPSPSGGGFATGGGGGGIVTGGSNPMFPTLPPSTTTTTPPVGGGGITLPPTTTTTAPPNPPTVTTTTPPVGGPGTPTQPSNPVPAPAGLLLGAIALGTLASWRLGVRLLGSK